MISKPMLAGKAPVDLSQLQFPLLATPKLDGIRCLIIGGRAVSRTFKLIPNEHIQRKITNAAKLGHIPENSDSEILVRGRSFNDLSGDVRRSDGTPDFYLAVFDRVYDSLGEPYAARMKRLGTTPLPAFCEKVLPKKMENLAELIAYESECLADGYEGVMVRTPNSPYKCGRSTTSEGYLLKIKRFEDAEAMVYGVEEEMENKNVATQDAFGRTERSTHKANMVPKGRMGKLLVRDQTTGVEFEIGTGFDAATRQELWDKRKEIIGKTVKYKHQKSGAKEGGKPRFPVFLGFRDTWDL